MTNNISLQNQKNSLVNYTNCQNAFDAAESGMTFDVIGWLASAKWVVALAAIFSGIMEEEITPRFTLHILNVQLAGFFALCSAGAGFLLLLVCMAWFATSLCLAKRAYKK